MHEGAKVLKLKFWNPNPTAYVHESWPIFILPIREKLAYWFHTKRKSLGRHALITQLYHGLKTKENLAGYFNLKAWKDTNRKGSWWWWNNNPLPRFLSSETVKERKKNETPKASPLNIVTHLNSKATAGTKQSKRSLYSKNKPNVQSKEKNGCNRFKGSKGEDSEDLPAGLTVLFSAEDEMKPSERLFSLFSSLLCQ